MQWNKDHVAFCAKIDYFYWIRLEFSILPGFFYRYRYRIPMLVNDFWNWRKCVVIFFVKQVWPAKVNEYKLLLFPLMSWLVLTSTYARIHTMGMTTWVVWILLRKKPISWQKIADLLTLAPSSHLANQQGIAGVCHQLSCGSMLSRRHRSTVLIFFYFRRGSIMKGNILF